MFKQKIYMSALCAALMGTSIAAAAQEQDHGFTFGIDYGRTEAKNIATIL